MLEKFEIRKKTAGMHAGKNPFEDIDFKEIMQLGNSAYDIAKFDKLFANTEQKIEDFFESKKNYYKNLERKGHFRTDSDRQNELKNDQRGGGLAVKAL